jgi:hypothetical protein
MRFTILFALVACSSSEAHELAAPPVTATPAPPPTAPTDATDELATRALEKIANAIDAAKGDCRELGTQLSRTTVDIGKARFELAKRKRTLKTVPIAEALRARQVAQRPFLAKCRLDNPYARLTIDSLVGGFQRDTARRGLDADDPIY